MPSNSSAGRGGSVGAQKIRGADVHVADAGSRADHAGVDNDITDKRAWTVDNQVGNSEFEPQAVELQLRIQRTLTTVVSVVPP